MIKYMRFGMVTTLLLASFVVKAQNGFQLKEQPDKKKVDVLYNGKVMTAYCYFDSTEKPVLFPLRSVSGKTITRGYPVAPRPGERTDHPHHVGLWFNYESVNGLDFWNNSFAIPPERKHLYGSIKHQKILSQKASGNAAELKTLSHWVDMNGKVLLEEITTFNFSVKQNDFVIDRHCILKAMNEPVLFKDVKDGLLGLRLARSLEMPSKQQDKFVDNNGNETTVAAMNNEGVTGMYFNKEGITGDDVWSTRSSWACMKGQVSGEQVAIAIIDHPTNVNYPSYWHARGYGLFAVNPLGQKIFSDGTKELNLMLEKGQSRPFVYRIVIRSGETLPPEAIESFMKAFHQKKFK